MEIVWYGLSCFRLSERGLATVVTDPYDHRVVGYAPLKLKADIVTISHEAPGHANAAAVKGFRHVLRGPGEYEIGGVFITGVQTNGQGKRDPNEPRNTLYVFDYNGIAVAHLGDLRRVPSQTEIEALGNVQIALVPVGGSSLSVAKAAEVVSLLEPGIVIPMHYHTPGCNLKLAPLSKFLKEMGIGEIEAVDSLKVSATSIPEETRVVALKIQSS
ncbi:MAG: MBL fold metallo-hydrolase [Anaerolineales bacterium]|nr:MBL fold metallo-hydrolase [Anaerolineales bacterium]MCS7248655.1 MBL fold metallo-hydrolase [Anaerolineales bacterium]MDW8162468.1 MBL fold metallo-hydrolase [Anaerolineales bacterium]MDW8447903.1 MBL fold metallo-hydrolase [Anaerolineales bacterium]